MLASTHQNDALSGLVNLKILPFITVEYCILFFNHRYSLSLSFVFSFFSLMASFFSQLSLSSSLISRLPLARSLTRSRLSLILPELLLAEACSNKGVSLTFETSSHKMSEKAILTMPRSPSIFSQNLLQSSLPLSWQWWCFLGWFFVARSAWSRVVAVLVARSVWVWWLAVACEWVC